MVKMINDYVLVDVIDNDAVSNGGIILTSLEPSCTGTVVSVGPGKYTKGGVREEHNINVGDVIVFGKSSLNNKIKLDENDTKEYYVMKIGDIFGKKQ